MWVQRKVERTQRTHELSIQNLLRSVVAIPRREVDAGWLEQPDLVVVPQRCDRQAAQQG